MSALGAVIYWGASNVASRVTRRLERAMARITEGSTLTGDQERPPTRGGVCSKS